MKIFNTEQIRAWDKWTIEHEPISSIDLMERAASTFVRWFQKKFPNPQEVHIICGTGNNGGDGLAVARLLHNLAMNISVSIFQVNTTPTPDFLTNLERLPTWGSIAVNHSGKLPIFQKDTIVIDALLGSGINRKVDGQLAACLEELNQQDVVRIALDIPSGLFADKCSDGICTKAQHTFSFQQPKLAFFFAENADAVGEWHFEDIGLKLDYYTNTNTNNYYINKTFIQKKLPKRDKFSHKGTFGHALLVMGSYGKAGAAVLAARACLRSGVGLATVHIPKKIYTILQVGAAEAMVSIDEGENFCTKIPDASHFSAVGIGCGLGTSKESERALLSFLEAYNKPLVLDADALNILSFNKLWLKKLPKESILTPHPKEFERLFGVTKDAFSRNDLQREKANELGVNILLKGAHSCLASTTGDCYFNETGNAGMATAGSGDVLAGIITGLLAQGISPLDASLLGVFWHGKSGDLVAKKLGMASLLASDMVETLGAAYLKIIK